MTNARMRAALALLSMVQLAHLELPAQAQEVGDEMNASKAVEIDAVQFQRAYSAFRDFKSKAKDLNCFLVSIYTEDAFLHVDFIQKETPGWLTFGSTAECGTGISYLIDEKGKIKEKSYSR